MKLSDFDYIYPSELVASVPLERREASRLMLLKRQTSQISHHSFSEIGDFFKKDDVLILNDSRVFPCRLINQRPSGGRVEIFLVRPIEANRWEALITPGKKVKMGDVYEWPGLLVVRVCGDQDGIREVELEHQGDIYTLLEQIGHVPIPPYLNREDDATLDTHRYQTVYARQTGSVAAPTAGLHFTQAVLDQLKAKGVIVCFVTLHVGLGTFLPIRVDAIKDHRMHGEHYVISDNVAEVIRASRFKGTRITVVGTTALRALESAATGDDRVILSGSGYTEKFIHAPYEFKIVDRLLTNFHQPKSTLLVLVSALAGRDFIFKAYQEAIKEKYRLFSYGDCMLITD